MPDGSNTTSADGSAWQPVDTNPCASAQLTHIELESIKSTLENVELEDICQVTKINNTTDEEPNRRYSSELDLQHIVDEQLSLKDDTIVNAEADSAYGWIIVVAGFMINVFSIALPASYGVFQQAYKELPEFEGTSSLAIAFIGSLANAGLPLFSILAGRLVDQYGPCVVCLVGALFILVSMVIASFSTAVWQMIITQGFLFGVGTSLAHIPGISILPDWFVKRRGLATGIAVSGSGIGGLILGPVLRYLISHVGWRWTLRIIGIFGGSIIAISAMFLKVRTFRKIRKEMHFSNFKNPIFQKLYAVAVIYSFAYFVPFFYIPTYALKYGMTIEQGALLVGILSGASGLGRVTLGFASDHLGHINTLTGCLISATLGILLVWPFAISFNGILAFVLIYGYFIGGFVCLTSTVTAQLFGANGNIATGYLFGDLFGTPIAGAMIDHFTVTLPDGAVSVNYLPSILFAGLCFAVGSMLLMSIKMTVGNRKFFIKV
ncbi:hypothetical protein BATDEDRAFT_84863 [Batrachochytrium dendrobatidis JAM81]|uniref:Major facilitator superfamily (MFS) profile domain-containing protein n=1 Tax=Batrachochytrium dendrobatidis (strain JAM81 / FGSC 10211) TaxID=684364 RepID=F4NVR6_BATDJ|nr:uncharacterized protein BATDEDRAFT_84863 [Batrachochytrium dendrobatidis JAM81]EGF84131.1 hypothetical protein BATDEDRAFT_84863 [Batrachochytrium dendrobatidis JAM81]|eukprot:XP_006676341.1 hypothetical protein BATDEDRAFT_84863 [Batrachochytrium dendrobatidis JAM81]